MRLEKLPDGSLMVCREQEEKAPPVSVSAAAKWMAGIITDFQLFTIAYGLGKEEGKMEQILHNIGFDAGREAEALIITEAATQTDIHFRRIDNQKIYEEKHGGYEFCGGRLRGIPDGQAPGAVIESKLFYDAKNYEGEAGKRRVLSYIYQAMIYGSDFGLQVYLAIGKYDAGDLKVSTYLIGRNSDRFGFDKKLAKFIKFYDIHIKTGVSPIPTSISDKARLRSIIGNHRPDRERSEFSDIGDELFDAKTTRSAAEKREKALKAELKTKGVKAGDIIPTKSGRWIVRERGRETIDSEKLKRDFPEVYEQVKRENSHLSFEYHADGEK